ncbi:MAG: hypothetical protein AAFW84_02985 [Cyanobacteria bacterium J06635_15]
MATETLVIDKTADAAVLSVNGPSFRLSRQGCIGIARAVGG